MDINDEKTRDQILLILHELREKYGCVYIPDTDIGLLYKSDNQFPDSKFFINLGEIFLSFVEEGFITDLSEPVMPKAYKYNFTEEGEKKINEILGREK